MHSQPRLRTCAAPRTSACNALLPGHATALFAGIVDTLRQALGDGSEKVRRRVMATLGELLFYVATIESDAVRDGHEPPHAWQARVPASRASR